MSPRILELLTFLYGASRAPTIAASLETLLHRYALHHTIDETTPRPLTERDAFLITYGDQVRAPEQAPLQTLAAFLEAHVAGLISGVHLLPFYPSSSDDGFAVMDYYAVNPELGTWDDVAALGQHFDLMFDAVVNHVSAQSAWFQSFLRGDPRFRDWFIVVQGHPDLSSVVRPRAQPLLTSFEVQGISTSVWTTFSADQIDLNYANPDVLLAMLDVLLFYVTRGVRVIRLDAIAFLWKEIGTTCLHLPQTHAVVQLMRAVLDVVAPHVLLLTETNVPHQENLSYFGDGRNEAQLVYNFALPPLVLYAFHHGEATMLTRWAQTLTLPSDRVTFFNFLASHDGIGLNPVRGILSEAEIQHLVERTFAHGGLVSYKHNPDGSTSPYELNIVYFDALSNPFANETQATQIERFMCAQAIMLAWQGVPGIYFHSLFGSRSDHEGARASGMPRRINRQKLARTELERELADPQSLRAQVWARYRRLLQARRAHAAFAPCSAQDVLSSDPRVFAVLRTAPNGSRILCLHNVANARVIAHVPEFEHAWVEDVLSGRRSEIRGGYPLAPYQAAWLRLE